MSWLKYWPQFWILPISRQICRSRSGAAAGSGVAQIVLNFEEWKWQKWAKKIDECLTKMMCYKDISVIVISVYKDDLWYLILWSDKSA